MDKYRCEGGGNFCWECPACGNHVCANYVKKFGRICPHCYGALHIAGN